MLRKLFYATYVTGNRQRPPGWKSNVWPIKLPQPPPWKTYVILYTTSRDFDGTWKYNARASPTAPPQSEAAVCDLLGVTSSDTDDTQSVCSSEFKQHISRTNGFTAEIGFRPRLTASSVTLWLAPSSVGRKIKNQTVLWSDGFTQYLLQHKTPPKARRHRGRRCVIGWEGVVKLMVHNAT